VLDLEDVLHGRVICFDLETTGFSLEDCIIEIGAVEMIDGFRTGALFQSYVNTPRKIHPKATKVHGLTNEKLSTAPPIAFVLTSFLSWVGESPLVAHQASFDMRMLAYELQRLNLVEKLADREVFCTMRYYQRTYPSRSATLSDVVAHLGVKGVDYQTSHTALADAEALSKIFIELLKLKS